VNSGTRIFSIAALAFFGAFVAPDAGRVGEDGTGAMWVAPELLDALGEVTRPECGHEVVIAADLQSNGRVVFEWHPATGELTFATDESKSELTLPEAVSLEPVNSPIRSCESR
jgi:hypothetical protein